MPKSISVTGGNSKVANRDHNARDEDVVSKQPHIDRQKGADNIVLLDNQSLPEVYDKLFGAATEEYNSRQKRNDRKIKSYYTKIKNDGQKHLTYELVVQVGNREDTAVSMNPTAEIEALKRYAMEFPSRNPQLYVVGAYIHLDENTPHLHLDYIPVAYNCTSGLRTQNALDRALRQQGFASIRKGKTAQMAFDDAERLALERICLDMGINAKANQGLTKGRGHLSKAEFVAAKDKLNQELEPIRTEMENNLAQSKEVLKGAQSEGNRIVSESKAKADKITQDAETAVRELQRASEGHISELTNISAGYEQEVAELEDKVAKAEGRLLTLQNVPPRPPEPVKPAPYDEWKESAGQDLMYYGNNSHFDTKGKREKRRRKVYDDLVARYEKAARACAEWDSKWGLVESAQHIAERENKVEMREQKVADRESDCLNDEMRLQELIQDAVEQRTAELTEQVNTYAEALDSMGYFDSNSHKGYLGL